MNILHHPNELCQLERCAWSAASWNVRTRRVMWRRVLSPSVRTCIPSPPSPSFSCLRALAPFGWVIEPFAPCSTFSACNNCFSIYFNFFFPIANYIGRNFLWTETNCFLRNKVDRESTANHIDIVGNEINQKQKSNGTSLRVPTTIIIQWVISYWFIIIAIRLYSKLLLTVVPLRRSCDFSSGCLKPSIYCNIYAIGKE